MSTISREAGEKHFHRIIVSMKVLVFTRDDDLERERMVRLGDLHVRKMRIIVEVRIFS